MRELFRRIADGIDPAPLLAQIDAHPELWNRYPERRAHPLSPHHETDDIWLRYRDRGALTGPQAYAEPHTSVWYHPEIELLSEAQRITDDLAGRLYANRIGGVLMTRIPPGKCVYPHDDRGAWHAEFYTTKLWLALRANPDCFNDCWDHPQPPAPDAPPAANQASRRERVVMRPGEAWTFSNLMQHSVMNAGDTERIVLIMCFRCGP